MKTPRTHASAAPLVGAALFCLAHTACSREHPAPAPSEASTRPSESAAVTGASPVSADAASSSPVGEAQQPAAEAPKPVAPPDMYGSCEPGEGGSGKTYMGREIAEVMGHFGVGWLERPEREREERTDLLVNALKLKATDAVADIGAGSGYFTMRISPLVPEGVVYATDIQQEMLDIVEERALEDGALNVMPVLGEIDHCGLEANSVDVVLFVDAYHEFSHPWEMMTSIVRALKPGGRVYLVEYRLEDPTVPIKERHKMSEEQARREMAAVGLSFVENLAILPQQHIMVFARGG
jgi:protein-L-isoaspartate O-methyltransferase